MSDLRAFDVLGLSGTTTVTAADQAGTILSIFDMGDTASLEVVNGAVAGSDADSVTLLFGLVTEATDLPSLLPHNASDLERALEQASKEISGFDIPVSQLWDVETCPSSLLGWLAWAFSVDEWEADWPAGVKRSVIASSVDVHRRKGTVGAVKAALSAAGYGTAIIVEGTQAKTHDGSVLHGGLETYGDALHWAEYQIILARPITFDQAETLREICAAVAPARCHLAALDYTEASNRYNAAIVNDGAYSHGVN